ncbi:hypothetical protein [Paenibacillus vortex]|uniref:hypothetical protein n=1 Tax=Paenibacillus vortex TaxID=71995 RepID=UPI00031C0B52
MAKRKRKKKAAFAAVLKYEIYGIVLMTLSVIALSGEAPVGRSLSKMSGYLLGKYYFIIPLIGIYYGLMVMIHRKWPKRWNSRRTGSPSSDIVAHFNEQHRRLGVQVGPNRTIECIECDEPDT